MKVAVLADIHGNIHALEAILADIEIKKPDIIISSNKCRSTKAIDEQGYVITALHLSHCKLGKEGPMFSITSQMKSMFARIFRKKEFIEQRLAQRIDRAAESILENERLTADLDDAAAQALLDWGVASVKKIALSTASLDDTKADKAMALRLRATRQLMRSVNRWVADQSEMDIVDRSTQLTKIIGQASAVYGEGYVPPDQGQRDTFVRQCPDLADNPRRMVEELCKLIENSADNPN